LVEDENVQNTAEEPRDDLPDAEDAAAESKAPPAPIRPKEPRIAPPSSLQEIVGALLFASESPLTATDLRECVRGVEPEEGESSEVMDVYRTCTSREIEQAIHGLEKELERSGCGFRLVCAGGAYRLQTTPTCGRYVRALLHLDKPNRLSRAALETLAIIAYRQPATRGDIEDIRGVKVNPDFIRVFQERGWIEVIGRRETAGRPEIFGTTRKFLDDLGLKSLEDLPELTQNQPHEEFDLFVPQEKAGN
jgi:segregation and condensation protein B